MHNMFGLTLDQILVGIVVFLLSALYFRSRRPAGMPPGPMSLPVIGGLLSLRGGDVRVAMLRLRDKYGDVITIDMGGQRTVILASYDIIKEALVNNAHVFSDRPNDLFFIAELTQGKGLFSPNGKLWRDHRKFAHAVFREFGVGRPLFEERIHEEISHLLQVFKDNTGQPYDTASILQMSVSNIINNIIFGRRYDYDDPKFIKYMEITSMNFEVLGNSGALTVFTFLKYLPGDFFQYKKILENTDYLNEQFMQQVSEHRKSHTSGVVNDFIDAYLEEANKEASNPDTTFTDEQLVRVIADLFGAGTETSTTTLRWVIVYMLRNPEVQIRVQQEIDNVLGSSIPAMRDRARLPYTQAVLMEVQRMGDIVPLGVPHAVNEDTEFRGYHIPAGTTVLTFLYAAHRDPSVWKEPYKFNPDRFLDEQGQINKDEKLIPFSMGKRVCLGESLARMELFLFFTSMMQQLTFKSPPGQPLPPTEGIVTITHMPAPFNIIIEQRHH